MVQQKSGKVCYGCGGQNTILAFFTVVAIRQIFPQKFSGAKVKLINQFLIKK
jgi:hypothetical protein